MYHIKPISFNYIKKGFIALVLFVGLSQLAIAVDGIIVKSKSSKTSFSNMKKNLTLTLHSGFSYHDNKSFGFNKSEKNRSFNSIISFQKGNVTYILPYKNKTLLQKFKTPQKPPSH